MPENVQQISFIIKLSKIFACVIFLENYSNGISQNRM